MIQLKRAYEAAEGADGYRVLVDRLWPRGVTKAKARVDLWLKEVAPSDAARKSFGHDPEKWGEFQRRYGRELDEKADLLRRLKELEREHKTLTLLFAAKDEERNNAVVLKARLAGRR